jgi:hypothetical protein
MHLVVGVRNNWLRKDSSRSKTANARHREMQFPLSFLYAKGSGDRELCDYMSPFCVQKVFAYEQRGIDCVSAALDAKNDKSLTVNIQCAAPLGRDKSLLGCCVRCEKTSTRIKSLRRA